MTSKRPIKKMAPRAKRDRRADERATVHCLHKAPATVKAKRGDTLDLKLATLIGEFENIADKMQTELIEETLPIFKGELGPQTKVLTNISTVRVYAAEAVERMKMVYQFYLAGKEMESGNEDAED